MPDKMVQLLDLSGYRSTADGRLIRNEQETDRGSMCYFASPFDFPAYVRFFRRVSKKVRGKEHNYDHEGTTMEVDMFSFGLKVYLRWDRAERRLKIITEATDGTREVLAEYNKEE